MSLTTDDVRHIAKLSRLHLNDAEIEKFRNQMAAILDYIAQLNEVDTANVQPTVNTTGILNRMREDQVGQSFSPEQATANAAAHDNNFFIVPNVFE